MAGNGDYLIGLLRGVQGIRRDDESGIHGKIIQTQIGEKLVEFCDTHAISGVQEFNSPTEPGDSNVTSC